MTAPRRTAGLRDAWAELRALAVRARGRDEDGLGDWDPEDTRQAILAWEMARLPFSDCEREVHRVMHDPEGSPAEIRGTARARSAAVPTGGHGVTREEREELRAKAIADCAAVTEAQKQAKTRDTAA